MSIFFKQEEGRVSSIFVVMSEKGTPYADLNGGPLPTPKPPQGLRVKLFELENSFSVRSQPNPGGSGPENVNGAGKDSQPGPVMPRDVSPPPQPEIVRVVSDLSDSDRALMSNLYKFGKEFYVQDILSDKRTRAINRALFDAACTAKKQWEKTGGKIEHLKISEGGLKLRCDICHATSPQNRGFSNTSTAIKKHCKGPMHIAKTKIVQRDPPLPLPVQDDDGGAVDSDDRPRPSSSFYARKAYAEKYWITQLKQIPSHLGISEKDDGSRITCLTCGGERTFTNKASCFVNHVIGKLHRGNLQKFVKNGSEDAAIALRGARGHKPQRVINSTRKSQTRDGKSAAKKEDSDDEDDESIYPSKEKEEEEEEENDNHDDDDDDEKVVPKRSRMELRKKMRDTVISYAEAECEDYDEDSESAIRRVAETHALDDQLHIPLFVNDDATTHIPVAVAENKIQNVAPFPFVVVVGANDPVVVVAANVSHQEGGGGDEEQEVEEKDQQDNSKKREREEEPCHRDHLVDDAKAALHRMHEENMMKKLKTDSEFQVKVVEKMNTSLKFKEKILTMLEHDFLTANDDNDGDTAASMPTGLLLGTTSSKKN